MNKLVIVDGNSLANRAFYALPFLTNSKVQPSGAIYGFANLVTKIITDYRPDGIVVAFDHARKTFRTEIYPDYKGTRKPTPIELTSQFPEIKKMLSLMKIKVIEQDGIEADDIIGTIAKNSNCDKIIVSGDRDLLQLISKDTEVWLTMKGVTELLKVNESNLVENFEVINPSQIVELKALMGDKSDNIPGVSGIGEKTALKLLKEFGSLDGVYANLDKITGKNKEKLENDKKWAYLSKELATIKTDCEIDFDLNDTGYDFPYSQETYNYFNDWNFNTLLKRKDLFNADIAFEVLDENVEILKLNTVEDVKKMKAEIGNEFAYNLDKFEFCTSPNKIYRVEPIISMFNIAISLEEVLEELKDVFEDESILKITDFAKRDMHKLGKLGISLKNFYDITLAGYVLYTGITSDKVSKITTNLYFSKRKLFDKNMEEFGSRDLFYNCELPLVEVLCSMEKLGFKIDKQELNKIDIDFSNELSTTTREIHELAGEEFNINSPKAVANILFGKLGLIAQNNKKQSTSVEILQEIAYQHPIVEKIIKYRKFQKFKTSYVEVYKKLCEDDSNIIHTQFNQSLTNTGRLSSSDPNLQNIPTRDEEGKVLRKIFISKFEDGQLVSADYNQIELRLLADMSSEEKLIETYKNGGDIHQTTASQIFSVPLEEVSSSQRRSAKAVNFGVIYGISDYGLAQGLRIPQFKAKEYIENYFKTYPKVKSFNEECVDFAHKNGYVKTKYGRVRHIPEINSSNHNIKGFAERVAMNMPLQGTASDIIKFAMIEVYKRMNEEKLKSELILQIHDELIVDVFPGEIDIVSKILKETMENIVSLQVPLVVNVGIGKNLYECKN